MKFDFRRAPAAIKSHRALTPEQAEIIANYLEAHFPWLLDEDADVSGADVVENLSSVHEVLRLCAATSAKVRCTAAIEAARKRNK